MSLLQRVAEGVAAMLAAEGVARWDPAGRYPAAGLPPVFLYRQPDQPDACWTVTPYLVDQEDGDATVGVQVRCRGKLDPRVPERMRDDAWRLLDRPFGVLLQPVAGPPVRVAQSVFRSAVAGLQTDPAGRLEATSNHYIIVRRVSPDDPTA